jgi:hypothetical protein
VRKRLDGYHRAVRFWKKARAYCDAMHADGR